MIDWWFFVSFEKYFLCQSWSRPTWHNLFSPRCCICVTFVFLISVSIELFYRPLCWLDLLLLVFIPQGKRNCLALSKFLLEYTCRLIKSSDIKCIFTLQILVGWLMLKYQGSLFIFMIQMERRLLEFNGNLWNDRSFLLAELFWQSLVQQKCDFSLNDNANALVLVVIVHVPSSCYVTPGHELNMKLCTWCLQWGYWLYINMYKWQLLLFFFTIFMGLFVLILLVMFCRQYSRETSIKKNRSCQSYR